MNKIETTKINGVLWDEVSKKKLKTIAEFVNGKLYISIAGYGDMRSVKGYANPVVIDFFDKKLKVVVWADINEEDPTHIIDLKGAKENNRKT